MRRAHTHHIITLAILSVLLGSGPIARAWAGNEDGVAPGEPAAPALEALLPQLLRTDLGKPYPMAAIKFGPEFWAALSVDAGGQIQDNLFRNLFAGGLLFAIGPLDNVLGAAQVGKAAAGRPPAHWTAPSTMKAALVFDVDEPNVQVSVEGQVVPLRGHAAATRPNSLLNQLEFVFFPTRMGGGEATLADLARRMTLTIAGLAPGAVQRFTWELKPPLPPALEGQGPIVVQRPPTLSRRDQARNQFRDAAAARMGAAVTPPPPAMGMAGGGLGGGGIGGGLGGGVGGGLGGPGGAPGTAGPGAGASLEAAMEPPAMGPGAAVSFYPLSRAASDVGALADSQAVEEAPPLAEAYVTVDQVSQTDDNVTLSYLTSPLGRQEVATVDAKGNVVQRIAGGPAPANGQALASWKPAALGGSAGAAADGLLVRNAVQTPLGSQVAETTIPLPTRKKADEPESAVAPGPGTVADVSVAEISVLGEMLQVRAHVAPVIGPGGPVIPEVRIAITDESGEVVKTLDPTPPAPDKDYVFAWDATNDAGERVPDGRYVLRVSARMDSPHGMARSELRYWIDVPLAKTQRRLAVLGPTALESLQVHVAEPKPGLVLLTFFAPHEGHMRAYAVDDNGRVVRRLLDADVPKGPQTLKWDGTDDAGNPLPDASYAVNFELDGGDEGAWWGVVTLDELTAGDSGGGQ
jgi:hypothetical protein